MDTPATRKRLVTAVAALTCAAVGTVAAVRSDGIQPTTVNNAVATRWLIDRQAGNVVLVDGLAGRVLARIDASADETGEVSIDGPGGTFLVDRARGSARPVDTSLLQLGTAQTVALLATNGTTVAVGPSGLTVVNPTAGEASVVTDVESLPLDVPVADQVTVTTDGALWLSRGDTLSKVRVDGRVSEFTLQIAADQLLAVGEVAVILDQSSNRIQWPGRAARDLPFPADQVIVQEPSPSVPCVWVAAGDSMACLGAQGTERQLTVDNLNAQPGDRLAVSGRAAAIIRANNGGMQRLDLTNGQLITDRQADFPADAVLTIESSEDLIWIDDTTGSLAWAVHGFGINSINKADTTTPLLDEQGDIVAPGNDNSDGPGSGTIDNEVDDRPIDDGNGIDDPPVAVDDSVSARQDVTVTVPVTANDYDPDGEGIVIESITNGSSGTVEILNAGSLVYRPQPGFIGIDTFEYTITDLGGQTASAKVTIELFDATSPNRPPIAVADATSTAQGVSVVANVLSNDVEPERDPLDIFSSEDGTNGKVTRVTGPTRLPSLLYTPEPGFTGTDTFSYIAVDPDGGLSEPTEITVVVGSTNGENQPPVARPDAVQVRRDDGPIDVAVLLNDVDPDNDDLLVSLVGLIPRGLSVQVVGDQIAVAATAGATSLSAFGYQIDDGYGHVVESSVLVKVVDAGQQNGAPIANPDIGRVVVGESTLIDVLANDTDPDNDPLSIAAVQQPADGTATVAIENGRVRFRPNVTSISEARAVIATYTVTDGRGNSARGSIVVTMLPEALPDPPFAQDDSATTERDKAVAIDVLNNDSDPSGGRPSLSGTPSCPGGGRATVTSDERVNFEPPRGAVGVFRCRYEVQNDSGQRASASIVITVTEPTETNRPPEIGDRGEVSVAAGESVVINLRTGVSDPDGDPVVITVTDRPAEGTTVVDGDVVTYTAPDGAPTITSIGFRASDDNGASTVGRISIRIVGAVPVAPFANNVRRVVQAYDPVLFDVLAAASDPDGPTSELAVQSARLIAGSGNVAVVGGGVLITPASGFVGDVVASFTIVDADGLTATATATLTVENPPNRAPVAVDDQLTISSGGAGSINLLFNDSDPDGDPLTVSLIGSADPSIGVVTLSGSVANVTATPRAAAGRIEIDYSVSDGELTDRGTLVVIVLACVESSPVARSELVRTPYQTPITINLNNFAENGTVVDVSGAGLTGPIGVYTPPAGENGNISVTFSVVNSCRLRANGTLTIDVNQSPVTSSVSRNVVRGTEMSISIHEFATDDEPLTISDLSGNPGWVTTDGTRIFVDVPMSMSQPTLNFSATVRDPGGLEATALITLNIQTNQSPIAVNDAVSITAGSFTIDPTANDSDPDGDPLSIRSASFVSGSGSITINGNELFITPDHGESVVSYVVEDPFGASDTGTILILANREPQAGNLDSVLGTGIYDIPAFDPDGDGLSVSLGGLPPGVAVDVLPGLRLMIDVGAFVGQDSFTYTVTDVFGASASATVFLNV